MIYEVMHEEGFLIIKLCGTVGVNEPLLLKESLTPHLKESSQKVVVDLGDLQEIQQDSILSVLDMIKREIQLSGGEVKFCFPPELYLFSEENSLDQTFEVWQSIEQAKRCFGAESNAG